MNSYDVSNDFQGGFTAKRTSTQAIVVHHAAADYGSSSGYFDVKAVADYHVNHNKWPGIGYHVCLAEETNGGPIARYIVSDLDSQRAHVLNRNHELIGVCCLTNFDDKSRYPDGKPTQKWLDALAETILWLKERYPRAIVLGHQEAAVKGGETACPGSQWKSWKTALLLQLTSGQTGMTVLETYPAGTRFRTIGSPVNVRRIPELRQDALMSQLTQVGTGFFVDKLVTGDAHKGSNQWVHAPNMGYIHRSLVEPEPAGSGGDSPERTARLEGVKKLAHEIVDRATALGFAVALLEGKQP